MIPNTVYAVTDSLEIITLKVISQEKTSYSILVHTEIVLEEKNERLEYFHRNFFEKLNFGLDFSMPHTTVFATIEEAKKFNENSINEELQIAENNVIRLKNKLTENSKY